MFGFIKIAKPTLNHGKMLVALKYKVEKATVLFPATKKKAAKEGPAFKVTCEGFVTDDVDATNPEALKAAVKEVIQGKRLFTYNTKFIVSPLANPLTGLGATSLLDKLQPGLSCLVTYSEESLKREGTSTPSGSVDASDILGALGIDIADL